MAWSLDWFAAVELALSGVRVRRVGWADKWLVYAGMWKIATEEESHVVTATEFTAAEFYARDWTTEDIDADVCGATPSFNTTPPVYRTWTDAPIFEPPPIPGFPDE